MLKAPISRSIILPFYCKIFTSWEGDNVDAEEDTVTKTAKSEPESTSVKLKRRVSSMIKGQKSILKKVDSKEANLNQSKYLKDMKIRRQSMTYRQAPSKFIRSSSCPEIYKTAAAEADRQGDMRCKFWWRDVLCRK